MHVDIEYIPRKKAGSNLEVDILDFAKQLVQDIRDGQQPFTNLQDLAEAINDYQTLAMVAFRAKKRIKVYSWCGSLTDTNHTIIQIGDRNDTATAQILLHKIPLPEAKKGPGRPSGSGKRTEQLKVRCSPDTKKALQELQEKHYTGKSEADIIEDLILNNHAYLSLLP